MENSVIVKTIETPIQGPTSKSQKLILVTTPSSSFGIASCACSGQYFCLEDGQMPELKQLIEGAEAKEVTTITSADEKAILAVDEFIQLAKNENGHLSANFVEALFQVMDVQEVIKQQPA